MSLLQRGIAALRSRLGPARSAMPGNRLVQASRELTGMLAGGVRGAD